MCRKLICLASVVLVLSLVNSALALGPNGWFDEDINTTGGSGTESNGTFSISGEGADIWGSSDAFHYTFKQLEGDGEMIARVVSNGTGSNDWAKGGVMIREMLDAGSVHAMTVITGGSGGGAGFQWRPEADNGSSSVHDPSPAIAPPYWVKIVRQGNTFSGYLSADGVTWTQQGDNTDIAMSSSVHIGLCVTSHAGGEIRTFEFDNVSWSGNVGDAPPQLVAYEPTPADGSLFADTWVSANWQPGETAVSHDVYISDVLADVEAGAADAFVGNQAAAFFIAGFAGFPFPDGLVPGVTYYWRVDEVEADGTTHAGDVWSFSIPSKKAYGEIPGDGGMFVPVDVTLEWTGGFGSKLHTVFFGDDFDAVANATAGAPQGTTTFDPGALELNKTYYWRVDEMDPPFTHTGDVWSFTTTLPGLGTAIMDRWENISGTDINLLKDSPKFPNNPDVTEIVTSFMWDGADIGDYGARIEAWVYAPTTGDYTFWLACDDNGELWVSTDDDSSNSVLVASIPGWTNVDEWTKFPSQKSEPISLVAGERYYVQALWKEGGGGDNCQVAWEGPGIATRTVIPGGNMSPFEPVSAFGAKPSNRATGVTQTPVLTWKAGLYADSHEVYFGTDEAAVTGATKASPEYKGSKTLGDESFDPGQLPWESTFFWRVDEVAAGNPDSPWVGSVWSFTTADFVIVDDFESYTDNDAANEAIWQYWIDGYGVAGNGSLVGYAMPPYAEQAIVQGGRQSMPLSYANTAGVMNSEAELKLVSARNWAEGNVATLSIWFQGQPASTGGFVEGPVGTFTMKGSGTDIWNNGTAGDYRDEFHFAYKTLTGSGTIIARVDSVQETNGWAKAGVMIRETLEPGSRHAYAAVTPASGVASQGRIDPGGVSFNTAEGGITAPHWVKLERDIAGNFTVSHSADGSTWVPVSGATPQNIQMGSTVFVGLAVTSHDAALTTEAVFSNVSIIGNVGGQWTHQDIGIATNAAEPMYVAVSNATGAPVVVAHDDPAAAQVGTWTQWSIDLSTFSDQGINLSNVDQITIGLGAKGGAAAGGSGIVFIDSITLRRPAPEPQP